MESYCNMNASNRENYRNCSERSNYGQMNCTRNNESCKRDVQTGNCSRTGQNRMMPRCEREERMMQQCRREERVMPRCQREERMTQRCEREENNSCNRSVEVECVCKVKKKEECGKQDDMEALGFEFPVVMAYVPWQQWGDLYEAECGLMQGTIFKDLNYIFCGERC